MLLRTRVAALPAAAFIATLVTGCSDSVAPAGPAPTPGVRLSFATALAPAAASASRSPAFDITLVDDRGDTLVVDTAQVVLREIELASAIDGCTAVDDSTGATVSQCQTLQVGPQLVSLPLAAGVGSAITAAVPAGSYRDIEFELHKPGDGASDASFVAANPAFADASVRVTGTYRGQRFVFTSSVNDQIKMEFNPPVVVGTSASNVTVHVDVASWFTDASGATIAPTPNNASRIADRIRASFSAYEDDDRDGHQD